MGMDGWEEKLRIRLNSAQFKLKLLVGAELGNNKLKSFNHGVTCGPSDILLYEIVDHNYFESIGGIHHSRRPHFLDDQPASVSQRLPNYQNFFHAITRKCCIGWEYSLRLKHNAELVMTITRMLLQAH